jgi:hypothetical protein
MPAHPLPPCQKALKFRLDDAWAAEGTTASAVTSDGRRGFGGVLLALRWERVGDWAQHRV